MQPPLCRKAHAVDHMTQETQAALDDEDQMAEALAEIRSERTEGEPVAVEAAPKPVEDEVQAQDAQQPDESAPAAESTKPDPAEQLRATQAELHKARSELGRVGALNHKYMQAAQEAAALREQLSKAQQQPVQPQDGKDARTRLDAVAEQVKDFPELAGIVSAVSDALKQADQKTEEVARRVAAQVVEPLEPLRREQTSRIQSEQKAAFDAALATFNSTYPTAVQVIQSDDFKQWLEVQPPNVQVAFAKGRTPQEAMTVLDTYDMHLRRNGKSPIAQINQPQPEQKTEQRVADNRLHRAAGIAPRANGSAGSTPPSDDFDASLAYFRNQRLKAAARAAL